MGFSRVWHSKDPSSKNLETSNLQICPENICKQYYSSAIKLPKGLTDDQICAANLNNHELKCSLSPSGPLIKRDASNVHHVVGILSFGGVCGSKDPRVYTKVSSHVQWIQKIIYLDIPKHLNNQ